MTGGDAAGWQAAHSVASPASTAPQPGQTVLVLSVAASSAPRSTAANFSAIRWALRRRPAVKRQHARRPSRPKSSRLPSPPCCFARIDTRSATSQLRNSAAPAVSELVAGVAAGWTGGAGDSTAASNASTRRLVNTNSPLANCSVNPRSVSRNASGSSPGAAWQAPERVWTQGGFL